MQEKPEAPMLKNKGLVTSKTVEQRYQKHQKTGEELDEKTKEAFQQYIKLKKHFLKKGKVHTKLYQEMVRKCREMGVKVDDV